MLVRDVPEFEEKFAADVLAFVKELGFTGRDKEPQRVVQEGCLPFHPSMAATARPQKVTAFLCACACACACSFFASVGRGCCTAVLQ